MLSYVYNFVEPMSWIVCKGFAVKLFSFLDFVRLVSRLT